MYKILVKNLETGVEWWEYGFSKYLMKRIYFLKNKQKYNSYEKLFEIEEILRLGFTFSTFRKCLFREKK